MRDHELTRAGGELEMRCLAALVDASEDALIAVDLAGTVLAWNRAAVRMYGHEAGDIVGRAVCLVVPPDGRDELFGWLDQVRRGSSPPPQVARRVTASNGSLDVVVRFVPVHDCSGAIVAVGMVERDVAEQRWIAETLDATLGRLQAASAQAREAEEVARRFLADAAHQLATPLAGIQACAENLLRGSDDANGDRVVADLVREAVRAGRLLRSLLRVARLDEGEPLVPVPCDIVAVCSSEIDRAWSLAPHLEMVLRAGDVAEGRTLADSEALHEIVANLLDNARRHARQRVEVAVEASPSGISVRVVDDGDGVPSGMEERVFERFISLDDRGGSGLGLAIARQLAHAHGGDVRYDGGGFVVSLPLAPPLGGGPNDPGVPSGP